MWQNGGKLKIQLSKWNIKKRKENQENLSKSSHHGDGSVHLPNASTARELLCLMLGSANKWIA